MNEFRGHIPFVSACTQTDAAAETFDEIKRFIERYP